MEYMVFDTFKLSKQLAHAGVNESVTEEVVGYVQEAASVILNEVASKKNLEEVKRDVDGLKKDVDGLKKDVDGLKKDVDGLKEDVGGLKKDVGVLKDEVQGIRKDLEMHELRHNHALEKMEMRIVSHENVMLIKFTMIVSGVIGFALTINNLIH